MKNRKKFILFIALFLMVNVCTQYLTIQGNIDYIPGPKAVGNVVLSSYTEKDYGTWFIGAIPKEVDVSKPPIIFVHGLNGYAQEWWEDTEYHGSNDMYELAYKRGYRTAFVQLHHNEGPRDQWENGKVLAEAFKAIYDYFGEEKANIVAHSKGGIDTQVALIYENAHPFVNKVLTIGSPHHGTNVADLFSSWYGKPLMEFFSINGNGSIAMQTANMEAFRVKTDSHPNIDKNRYYTMSGIKWGPRPSFLWLSGWYLSQYGENDGLIQEASTHLPYGEHIGILDFDHDLLRKGSATFSRIYKVIEGKSNQDEKGESGVLLGTCLADTLAGKTSKKKLGNDQYIDGGELIEGEVKEKEVFVDISKEAMFTIYTKSSDVMISFISPSGKHYTKSDLAYFSNQGSDIFSGMSVQSYLISKPEVGKWKVYLKSACKDAYLLITSFQSENGCSVYFPSISRDEAVPISLTVRKKVSSPINVTVKIVHPDKSLEVKELQFSSNKMLKYMKLGKKRGVYNLTFDIKWKTKKGDVVRTLTHTFCKK